MKNLASPSVRILSSSALTVLVMIGGCFLLSPAAGAQQAFSDVSTDHPAYQAIEYLRSSGIVAGYQDGTFHPDANVNRAEAIKFIIAPLIAQDQLPTVIQSLFTDVEPQAWYAPYVEAARENGIIAGPPEKTAFHGNETVIKAEFLKMLLLAHKQDPLNTFNEIQLPLSSDVANTNDWFYPYIRSAIASSMILVGQDGLLNPAQKLTRADTALFLYHFLMFKEKRRAQALLSEAENEILIVLAMLEDNNLTQAEYASARALLAARGAQIQKENEPIVQGALRITQAFRSLIRGYRAGLNKEYDETIRLAQEAWQLSDDARKATESLAPVAAQVQEISSGMAESARAQKAAVAQ